MAARKCGLDTWEDIEERSEIREDWLKTILKLTNGIPSHDTIDGAFSLFDPHAFQECFVERVKLVPKITDSQVISINGKRMCNSGEGGGKSMVASMPS